MSLPLSDTRSSPACSTSFGVLAARTKLATQSAATVLGGVLLIAGLLKASSSFASLYHFGAASIADSAGDAGMLALATVEIAIALMLAQRPFSAIAWKTTLALYSVFFVAALAQASAGRQMCDCFGAIVLKPHYTALFDIVAIGICGTVLASLRRAPAATKSIASHSLTATIFAFTFTFGTLLLVREARLGDMRYGIPPVVAELKVDRSDSKATWLDGYALLASRGGQPVRVVGCVQNCGLRIKRALPFDIEATNFTRLPLLIRRPSQAQVGLVPLTLLVDVGGSLQKLTLPLLTPRLSE